MSFIPVSGKLSHIKPQLENLYKEILKTDDTYRPDTPEERFLRSEIYAIGESLSQIIGALDVLNAPIVAEGELIRDSSGRWALDTNTNFFYTSGSSIEFYYDRDEEPSWIRSSVEHSGGYYIVGYNRVEMKGLRVRIRQMPFKKF